MASSDDTTCAICFRMFYDPITTPCNHTYCRRCLQTVFNKTCTLCPLCRTDLSIYDLHMAPVDHVIKARLKEDGPSLMMYKARKIEHLEELALAAAIHHVKISIGNLHQHVASSGQNCHKWTFFLLAHDGSDLTKYIKKVTVHLHPTFHPNKIVMSEEPYMFSRVGWGVFGLKVQVEYHECLQKTADTFTHMLSFQANGNASSHELEIDSRNIPQEESLEDAA